MPWIKLFHREIYIFYIKSLRVIYYMYIHDIDCSLCLQLQNYDMLEPNVKNYYTFIYYIMITFVYIASYLLKNNIVKRSDTRNNRRI